MNGLDMIKGPDPQADAMQADFARAAGTDPGQEADTQTGERQEPNRDLAPPGPRDDTELYRSFAHEVSPDAAEQALQQEFNLTARDPTRAVADGQRQESPADPSLKPTPPEFRLPPDLQAQQDRLDAKLDFDQGNEVTWKRGQGPNLGL